jgi:hypothetical protein
MLESGRFELARGSGNPEQALMLTLLESQPVGRLHALRPPRLGSQPALDGGPQVQVVLEPVRERDIGQPDLEPQEQLPEGPQAL